MSLRAKSALSILACLIAVGCKELGRFHIRRRIYHRVGRRTNPATSRRALAQPLVVQVLDGANKAGVRRAAHVDRDRAAELCPPPTSTTDNDGKATVTWTLSTAAGVRSSP